MTAFSSYAAERESDVKMVIEGFAQEAERKRGRRR